MESFKGFHGNYGGIRRHREIVYNREGNAENTFFLSSDRLGKK